MGGELRLVDLLAVHVDAVEASLVLDEEPAVAPLEHRVLARDGDVVEEDVAVGIAPRARRVLLDEERRPRVRATLHEKESLARLELVAREGEVVLTFIL